MNPRKRVVWKILGSGFALWHILVLAAGPAPGSHTLSRVWPYLKPYLTFSHLENYWAFFAPNPSAGSVARYVLQDAEGNVTWHKFTEVQRRSSPRFLRHTSVQNDLEWPSGWFRWAFADWLARQHADLRPKYVQFVLCHQRPVYRDDWLAGRRPLEDDFMTPTYSEVIELPVDFPALIAAEKEAARP
jgi:hypothetical protein